MNNVNHIRAFGFSQYVAISVTEVSNLDMDFTETGLMLILYQEHSTIDLLVLFIVNHIDIGWTWPSCERIIIIQKINELTFLMQHTGSRICYLTLRKKHFDLGFYDRIVA